MQERKQDALEKFQEAQAQFEALEMSWHIFQTRQEIRHLLGLSTSHRR
jgi:hypothetical protein